MNLNKNVVALQRNLVVPPDNGMDNRIMVMTIQAQLMTWGYMLDEDAFQALGKADASWLEVFYQQVMNYLRDILGGKHNFTPLYKNFPQEVMALSDAELFWNTIRHYWTNGKWEPTTPVLEKPVKFEKIKYTLLKPADQSRFSSIFTTLVSLNTSLTPTDLAVIQWFAANEPLEFPDSIPFKENLCTLAGMGLDVPVKTTTDILRIAVFMSGGDISLPAVPPAKVQTNRWSRTKQDNPKRESFKFKKFKRSERRLLLGLLEKTHCNPAEMVLKDQRWIRLGEILHPGEYQKQFPNSYAAFNLIRNNKVKSWYSRVEYAFKEGIENGIATLAERPGEYVRRIDFLFRKYPAYHDKILLYLYTAVLRTSNKALFELYEHFEKRNKPTTGRAIMIKGARKKTQLPDLPALPETVIETVHQAIFTALQNKFSDLPRLGNVWIDERLKNIPLPKNMRSMNFSTKPSVRGTAIPFDNPETKVIRPFLHFKKNRQHITIDLSAVLIGRKNEIVSYSRLKYGDICTHSGDSYARTGSCAEYVDIDIQKALDQGFKYVLIQLLNFNGSSELENDNYFGLMEREYPESNKAWLPDTISNCHVINNLKTRVNCAILDLENRAYIMVDEDGDSGSVNVASVFDFKKVEDYIRPPKVSVYDLLLMHVQARGRLVTLDSNIDTYFKFEDFITSYEKTASFMI